MKGNLFSMKLNLGKLQLPLWVQLFQEMSFFVFPDIRNAAE
jgi:hypothetical protein